MHYEILAFSPGDRTPHSCPVIEHPVKALPNLKDQALGVTDQAAARRRAFNTPPGELVRREASC
jgi:hypothetical protein